MGDFTTSIDIGATPEQVFDYLVTAQGLTLWMGEYATLDPTAGGVFEVNIAGSPIRGHFVEVDRPHRVVVTWGMAGSAVLPPGASTVSFALEPIPSGTRLDLHHSDLPDSAVEGHADGWEHFMPRLVTAGQGGTPGDDDWVPLR